MEDGFRIVRSLPVARGDLRAAHADFADLITRDFLAGVVAYRYFGG